MRISITDRCNLRCRYCMPDGIVQTSMKEILTYEEILEVARAAVSLGIVHFRVTGGEPLVRKDAEVLVSMLKSLPGTETVTMTSNGVLLKEKAGKLKDAGLDGINISLDTVCEKEYEALTGSDVLAQVLEGIDAAVHCGLTVKLNAVDTGNTDKRALIAYAQEKQIPLRFIELMPIGNGQSYAGHSSTDLLKELETFYGKSTLLPGGKSPYGSGPAVYYQFENLEMPIGLIRAVHHKFCASCNRVRLTSMGWLKLCLCYGDGLDLKEKLRSGISGEALTGDLEQAIFQKPAEHCFLEPASITEKKSMATIGG
jgi:cyclic pyranopterin phosphate synthase